ncbi:class I SAM-dependent methyltransferase [Monashia sp. NPDC004114]
MRLNLGADIGTLWEHMAIARSDYCAPPFWAFPWAGGQALARHVIDHPELVAGRTVLDLAAGSGLVALAAAHAGARSVTANDVDPYAAAAIELNARANRVTVHVQLGDLLAEDEDRRHDVVLAGDVCYSRELALRVVPWLTFAAQRGTLVLLGDPGRAYAPREGYAVVATYEVPVVAGLEQGDVKRTTVLTPAAP